MARKRTRARAATTSTKNLSSTAPLGRRAVLILAAALVLLTTAAYTPVWRFDFVALDDPQYVSANPNIAHGLTAQTIAWAFTTAREANWHPLTWISHALDIQIFGLDAGWHHVTNLVFHLATTLLLFGVLRRMTRSVGRSAFVAGVFALHPLHVESVAWVAERKDVLSAFFFVLTLGAYVRYTETPGRGRYIIVALCLALGLMAKAMLVTTPMVLLLLDWWPLARVPGPEGPKVRGSEGPKAQGVEDPGAQGSWGTLVVEKIPLFAIVAASSVVTFLVQRHGGAVRTLESMSIPLRIQNAIVSYVDYLTDIVWPAGLGVFYPLPTSIDLTVTRVAIAVAVLVAITTLTLLMARRAPYLAVGWFWFAGMLVPVSGILQAGTQARADRFVYLPMIGLAIAVAWGAIAIARVPWQRRLAASVGVAVILVWTAVTHAQVQYWRNTVALWSHTAAVTDDTNNFGVYFSLGEYIREYGRAEDAIPYYETAIRKNPAYTDARFGLVRALIAAKQPPRAIVGLQELVQVAPTSVEARMSLGLLLVEAQRSPEAIEQFREAARLQPDSADAPWRLGIALASSGRQAEALTAFADAVRLAPASAPIRADYGWALVQHHQTAEGLVQLREALRLKPDLVDAHHNLGRLLLGEGQTAEALAHLSEAVRLEPGFIDAHLTLAAALIRVGRVDDAATELRAVLRLDPRNEAAQRLLAGIGREER